MKNVLEIIIKIIVGAIRLLGALLFVIYYLGDEVVEKFKEKGKNQ